MAYWNQTQSYATDKPVIAFVDNVAAPHSVTVTDGLLGLNRELNKTFPAGLFIANYSGTFSFLKRSFVTNVASTTVFTASNAELFKVGDVIVRYVVAGTDNASAAVGTIAGIDYSTGVITLAAAATNAITAGTHSVGVVPTEVLGVHPHSVSFDNAPRHHLNAINQAGGVYEGVLPYVDGHIKTQLSALNIRTKF